MKQVQKNPFIHYILSDQVWWCNVEQFLSYSKNYICKFLQVSSWHHKLFHFHLTFLIWKVWKGREKTQKFKYLKNEKSFLDEINNIFRSFWKAIIWWKIKTWKKIADTSFKSLPFSSLRLQWEKIRKFELVAMRNNKWPQEWFCPDRKT